MTTTPRGMCYQTVYIPHPISPSTYRASNYRILFSEDLHITLPRPLIYDRFNNHLVNSFLQNRNLFQILILILRHIYFHPETLIGSHLFQKYIVSLERNFTHTLYALSYLSQIIPFFKSYTIIPDMTFRTQTHPVISIS